MSVDTDTRPAAPGLSDLHRGVLRLFRAGNDTVEIARLLDIDEARAERLLHEARQAARAAR